MSSDDKPFSVRMGIIPERAMQTEKLDAETLMRIVNAVLENAKFHPYFDDALARYFFTHQTDGPSVFLRKGNIELHIDRGLTPHDSRDFGGNFPRKVLNLLVKDGHWWTVLDFIEFILDLPDEPYELVEWIAMDPFMEDPLEGKEAREYFISSLNGILNWMNVGYRLMPTDKFINVHSDEEAEEIGKACSGTSGPFAAAQTHMKNAVANFRNTDQPNHASTVTEAIHAVESIVKELTGKEDIKAGLHQLAEKGIVPDIRPHSKGDRPFVTALEKYWTYANATSRHGRKKGVEPPDRDTARFLLVTCATLVNYITTRHLAVGKSS